MFEDLNFTWMLECPIKFHALKPSHTSWSEGRTGEECARRVRATRGGRGAGGKGSRAHVATINLHSDVIGEEQVTEQEDSLSGMGEEGRGGVG